MAASVQIRQQKEPTPQAGALCYRVRSGKPQVLLITSRTTKRWIIPKGWLIDGLSEAESAATEAWEEAGVRGKVHKRSLGHYGYLKVGEGKAPDRVCSVAVYPLEVKSVEKRYPERGDRRRRWMSPKRAAEQVDEKELQSLLANFDPRSV